MSFTVSGRHVTYLKLYSLNLFQFFTLQSHHLIYCIEKLQCVIDQENV